MPATGHHGTRGDAQIAAICHAHEAALATRSIKDFLETGVTVIDP